MTSGIRMLLFSLIFAAVLIAGCKSDVTCPVCGQCTCQQCPTCECPPAEEATEDADITLRYVCPDDRIVEAASDCKEQTFDYTPVTTNEVGTSIQRLTIEPACIQALPGGVIRFKAGAIPDNVTIQMRDIDGAYQNIYQKPSKVFEDDISFTFCDNKCSWYGDFHLETGKVYIIRAEFDFTSTYNLKQYSNEHIIDARQGSNYTTRVCKVGWT